MFTPANGVEYTEAEKQKILNISKLTTGVVAAYAGYDVTSVANAADTAVTNNYLSHAQEKLRSQEFKNCNVVTCGGVVVKWAAIDAGQDASYAAGFASGIPVSVAESVVGLAQMALSPIQTFKAIKDIISSENALGNITDAVKQDYTNRINKLEAEYQKAGPSGSYNAGLEAGKLTTDVASLFAGGAGLAKGGIVLTEKIAAKISNSTQKVLNIHSSNGIHLDPRLPKPEAGYDYKPNALDSLNSNISNSHINGYKSELLLANQVAAMPDQVVLKYGDVIGRHGADIISVNPQSGKVYLWDAKFRSSNAKLPASPTFTNQISRDKAVSEALNAINNSNLPQNVKLKAIDNLDKGTFTTYTVATGNSKNSVMYICINKVCK
ncbi:VENN motif pre-toxin domain-containing protein [Acinetobacter gyllenbergii]|uniref:VENN motif pre-toxin domain-containing protein n=1 Tax=Acinetobacter gyllenbergii TaxID=134534 RepID=UPI0021CF773D|nr:VENN motif pre-toxin domain-containing protein [Acinetobacter gyllenbergii]